VYRGLVSIIEELLGRRSRSNLLESRGNGRRNLLRRPSDTRLSANLAITADKRRSLGRYSSLADKRHEVYFFFVRLVRHLPLLPSASLPLLLNPALSEYLLPFGDRSWWYAYYSRVQNWPRLRTSSFPFAKQRVAKLVNKTNIMEPWWSLPCSQQRTICSCPETIKTSSIPFHYDQFNNLLRDWIYLLHLQPQQFTITYNKSDSITVRNNFSINSSTRLRFSSVYFTSYGQSTSTSWCVAHDQIFPFIFLIWKSLDSQVNHSLWREDGFVVFTAVNLLFRSHRTHNHTSVSHPRLAHFTPVTVFLFSSLLPLTGLRWRYSNLLPQFSEPN
jgi:hypothetical protein